MCRCAPANRIAVETFPKLAIYATGIQNRSDLIRVKLLEQFYVNKGALHC